MFRKSRSLVLEILVVVLAVILLVFGIGEIQDALHERKELLKINREKMKTVNDGLTSTLKHLMILEHSKEVGDLIELLRGISGVEELYLIKSNGLEAFAAEGSRVMVDDDPILKEVLKGEEAVEYEEGVGKSPMLTYLSPILSEERCVRCHGAEQKVLGVLKISFSTADVQRAARSNVFRSLAFFFATLLISGVLLYALLNRIVKQPVGRILDAIKRIAAGDLTQRLRITSGDEIGEMASAFDQMTEQLEESQTQLQEYSSRLEDRVKERTGQLEERVRDLNDTRSAILNVLEDATLAKTEAEESEAKARSYAMKLTALHEATQTLTATLEFQEVIERCATIAKELINADGVTIFLLNPDRARLEPIVAKEPEAEKVMAISLKLNEGITGQVAASGRAEIVNRVDLTDRGKLVPGTTPEPESLMCAPLKTKDQVIGAMTLRRLGENEFTNEDLTFLENLANVSVVAIQNASLYEVVQQSERDYRSLIETAVDPVIAVDESSCVLVWNEAATRTFGFTEKEMLGKPLGVIYPSGEAFKKHRTAVAEFLKTGQSELLGKTLEFRARHKEGHLIDISLSISARQSEQGWVFTAIIKDITEAKEARREIERLANFPQENPLPMVEVNSDGNTTYVNPAGKALLRKMKLTRGEIQQILPPGYRELVTDCLKTGENIPAHEVHLDSSVLLWTGHPLRNLSLVHFYATDITDLKKTEQELLEAKERAETSDRLKNVFLSTMSHEVRTPLNVLLGYSDLLTSSAGRKLSSEERGFIETMKQSGERLKRLIDDILDVSLIEADKTVLDLKLFPADTLVEKCVTEIVVAARKKKLGVIEDYHASDVKIKVDRLRIQQAIVNILQNSVKFTREGCITITTRVDDGEYQIAIKDTGIGIKEEFKPYLFTLFRQAEEGYSRSYEGAGLGLAISQRLVAAMGGRIEVDSELGKGSTFTICLPAHLPPIPTPLGKGEQVGKVPRRRVRRKRGEKAPTPAEIGDMGVAEEVPGRPAKGGREPEVGKVTVLILEDNPANLKYLEFLVKRLGLGYISAKSAESAAELLKKGTVDCMLIDISLAEGMSGVEFMKRMKKRKKFKSIPMIAVTAHAMKGQKEEYLQEGFSDYLAKPFTLRDLKEILDRNLCAKTPTGSVKVESLS